MLLIPQKFPANGRCNNGSRVSRKILSRRGLRNRRGTSRQRINVSPPPPLFLSFSRGKREEGMDIRRGVYMIYNARKGAWLTCEIFGGNGWRGGRGRASCTFSTFSARVRAWNRPEKGPLLSVGQRRRLLEITNLLEKEREGRRRIGLDWLFREIRFYLCPLLYLLILLYIFGHEYFTFLCVL